MPGMAGGGKVKAMPSESPKLALQLALDSGKLLVMRLALIPWLERDEEEGRVGALRECEEREAVDGDDALDAGRLKQGLGDLLCRGIGALQAEASGSCMAT